METRKEIIKQMGDEMREDIFLEVNNRIERSLRRRFWLRISAVAASVTLLFGISNYISFHEGYKKLNSQMIEMVNPMGMRSSVVLSDGTKVILNAGTTLSYPAAFVSGQREVKVNGEAFFEVSFLLNYTLCIESIQPGQRPGCFTEGIHGNRIFQNPVPAAERAGGFSAGGRCGFGSVSGPFEPL